MYRRPACPGRVYWASGALPVPVVLWVPGAALGRRTEPKLKKTPKSHILGIFLGGSKFGMVKKFNTGAAREESERALSSILMCLIDPDIAVDALLYKSLIYFVT